MLKLAKAWHIAHMLQLVHLQNKLVATFSATYRHHIKSWTQVRVEPEAFQYLEDHLGTHTKIEKFIIDFYAGLARYRAGFSAQELEPLPRDVAAWLRRRREQLAAHDSVGDPILNNDNCYDVTGEETTRHHSLQVINPVLQPLGSSSEEPVLSRWRSFSVSSLTSWLSGSSLPQPLTTTDSTRPNRRSRCHRSRLSLPILSSLNGQPDDHVSRALAPALQSTLRTTTRPTPDRSNSMMTILPSRAPFMPTAPLRRARSLPDDSSSDEETDYGLWPPRLPT